MHPSSPPPRNVDSTLARILRFVIKGYCYSPSRFLSSSRGKRNFRWLEKEIPRFFSLFFSLTDCSFHSITIKLPYRETFPELKNVSRFQRAERERDSFPRLNDRSWTQKIGIITNRVFPFFFPPSLAFVARLWCIMQVASIACCGELEKKKKEKLLALDALKFGWFYVCVRKFLRIDRECR